MDLEYPKGFPEGNQTKVELERIRADRDLRFSDPEVIQSEPELHRTGLRWVCRVLGAFCHEACELGKRRSWTLMQIRSEVGNFRLHLVQHVHFRVARGQLGWVDRVFGTSIETEVRRAIETSEEWKSYLDQLSVVAEMLANSGDQKALPKGEVGSAGSPASGDSAAAIISEAASRERRLEQFRAEKGVTYTDIARSAGVHKPEFQKWRNGQLKAGSLMAQRIESVLSGKRAFQRKLPSDKTG